MINGGYLIPANTKAGALILGYFRPVDLIILGSGVLITLLLLIVVQTTNTLTTILVFLTTFLAGAFLTVFGIFKVINLFDYCAVSQLRLLDFLKFY